MEKDTLTVYFYYPRNEGITFQNQDIIDIFTDIRDSKDNLSKPMQDDDGNMIQISWKKVSHVNVRIWKK